VRELKLQSQKKSFLFLGEKPDGQLRLMVKLNDGIASAQAVAEQNPDEWNVGGPGWVVGNFTDGSAPSVETLTAWIDESCRLQVPKKLLAELDA
jgi:hypothetical protein